jgi:hypothetical protein
MCQGWLRSVMIGSEVTGGPGLGVQHGAGWPALAAGGTSPARGGWAAGAGVTAG